MKKRKSYTCPLEITHDAIKGKWKPIILWILKENRLSLSAIERSIKGINQKMLLEQLKELIGNGLVSKNTFEGYPLKVEYYLTDRGREMVEAIRIMQKIGMEILHSDNQE